MAKTKSAKSKKKDLITEEDLKPENVRWNITIRLPGDLVEAYRAQAEKMGIGYQTLMQMKLREALQSDSIEKRMARIEAAVFKKTS